MWARAGTLKFVAVDEQMLAFAGILLPSLLPRPPAHLNALPLAWPVAPHLVAHMGC